MRSPMNWHLPISLDWLSATSLPIDTLCFRNATLFVISIMSRYYFMPPCISYAGLSLKEFSHSASLPELFYVVNFISTYLPNIVSSSKPPQLSPLAPPFQCYFISQLYFNYCSYVECAISLNICIPSKNINISREYVTKA